MRSKDNRELAQLCNWLLPMQMNGQATVAEENAAYIVPFPSLPQIVEVRQVARNYAGSQPKRDDTAALVRFFKEQKS